MSRTPATYSMPVVRGQTWDDYLDYVEDDEVTPIDLTGFQARMQVRTLEGEYGTTTTTTLVLELSTQNGLLEIVTPPGGVVPNRVQISVSPDGHAEINSLNAKKKPYAYALEVFRPAVGETPLYSLPLAKGRIGARGWGIR